MRDLENNNNNNEIILFIYWKKNIFNGNYWFFVNFKI